MIRRTIPLTLAFAASLGASTAHAAIVTVGSPLTAPYTPSSLNGVGTASNFLLPEAGANVLSPIGGVIIRWRLVDASGGPFKLRVLTPTATPGTDTGAGTSAPEMPTGAGILTLPAHLPIQAGQTIGLDNSNNTDQIGFAQGLTGSGFVAWVPPVPDGVTQPFSVSNVGEIAFNADVQPLPGVTAVSPSSGSIKGGTSVTITGHDFTGATAVTFGATNASSFSVTNDGQITAVAPAASTLGAVDVRVTTAAGQTAVVAGDHFAYTGCEVPKVTGKKLKTAKHSIKHAGCKVGKVKGKGPKVHKQHPKPKTLLAPGGKVTLKLGL